uniref:Putative LOC100634292 [Amphimedon queenslandica] n=1 Tax=Lepeophtheirus salmonis TaxID=72036 RepID=A0A0K2U8E6_LEPSM
MQHTFSTTYPFDNKLTLNKGILVDPNLKKSSRINKDAAQDVINFYKSEDVSRIIPGQKDQKDLILYRKLIKNGKNFLNL